MEKEEEEDGEEEEEEREAGGVVQRMICGKGGKGEGLDAEGRGSSSTTGGGGAGWEGASGISQTGGRSEAAAAGGAGGENRGPRDVEWFRISDSCSLALRRGDITEWFVDGKTDAIVNAANEAMLGGGGVDGAIHRAAGPQLKNACSAVPEVTRGVRCPTGSAVITGGFKLPASKVIHTVGPRYSSDQISKAPLAKAYRSSVAVATEAGVKYIAFPAISCGEYGYPHKKAAKIAIQTLKESSGGLLEVHFVLFEESTWNAWLAEAKALLKKA
jgi:O-acetyl-ADP-ribose deacetylase (regulator of RNase III)